MAIEAAEAELARRNLSETQLQTAREAIIEEETRRQNAPIRIIEGKMKLAGRAFFNTLNPILPSLPGVERLIRFIVIVFGGILLYNLIAYGDDLLMALRELPQYPIVTIEYLFVRFSLLFAVIWFWQRKSRGWVFLLVYIIYTLIGKLVAAVQALSWRDSGIHHLDEWFRPPPLPSYLPAIAFWLAAALVLCRKDIREDYSISEEKMIKTIVVTVCLIGVMIYLLSRFV